ncbi:TonB-dependent receptor [Robertkochia sediminum]|uniref:TonB-dependent receptor n=1 Tax=Robertkochia sediminum TaxID=2785326 RepID=UPI0019329533|nr:TonB-dependent receptor [Robertkochia sediminum]MBL7473804.1 TonB-dependent receptor [Robertkochia sediminum]
MKDVLRGCLLMLFINVLQGQELRVEVVDAQGALPYANVWLEELEKGAPTGNDGVAVLTGIPKGRLTLVVSFTGYTTYRKRVRIGEGQNVVQVMMQPMESLDEVVVSGTLRPVSRMETPVPVEVYQPTFFKKNPSANIFDALQMVNGVRPQVNCNVCNTGDIHINGLEGPYTLVLIDGMPLVGGLASVYGLSGIPNSLVDRIEIVKGPASSIYGSQAVGGLINVITKDAELVNTLSFDSFYSDWGEWNVDLGFKTGVGKVADVLTGVNYFNYDTPVDNNGDNFTDLTLQHRVSVFQKWNFKRASGKAFDLAGRFFYEDRWGGEMQWTPEFRGGTEVYGESIYTRRFEVMGNYELPFAEPVMLNFSYTDHDQNSVYGDTPYLATQRNGFSQLTWNRDLGMHGMLVGTALRYTYYNDDTPATANDAGDAPDEVFIPGIFVQDEMTLNKKMKWLVGARLDYDKRHGTIFTPRTAFKWSVTDNDILRFNAGTGFRVVNLFTEDHASLTGARDVVITEDLQPERSWNVNLNYLKKIYTSKGHFIGLDLSTWYTRFSNVILPDYDTEPDKILYSNLDGYGVSAGMSINADVMLRSGWKLTAGASVMDVHNVEDGERFRPVLTERFTGTWGLSYSVPFWDLDIDYTGNVYGPMRLPLLSDLDPRSPESPWYSLQNIQFTYKGFKGIELYAGVKNLLNWTPDQDVPFLIARANDPFDKNVTFDNAGNALPTPDNPYALTFDPSYVYASNQGIRTFFGLRYDLN